MTATSVPRRPARAPSRAGPLDAAGGPAAWCRATVRATRPVADLDTRLDAVCARAPRAPSLVAGPLFGSALEECTRDVGAADDVVDVPDAGGRRARGSADDRPATGRRTPAAPVGPRTRGQGRARPASAPRAPDHVLAPPAGRHPRRTASGHADTPADRGSAAAHLPVARLRALAGPQSADGRPRRHTNPRSLDQDAIPGPGAAPGPARRRARPGQGRSQPAAERLLPPDEAGPALLTRVVDRIVRRIAGRPGSGSRLAAGLLRAGAASSDPELSDLLARWSGAPGRPRPRRRRRAAGRGDLQRQPSDADPGRVLADPLGLRGPGAPPFDEPRLDEREVRAPSRFAEQPTRPRRLADLAGETDGTETMAGTVARAGEGAGALGTGAAATAADTSARPGVGGAVPAVSAPELERLLDRVLGDAARRHGIEV